MKKTKQVSSSLTVFLLLVLSSVSRSTNGLCLYEKNNTDARCDHLEDIKFINTYGLKRLKILSIDNHLPYDYFNKLENLQHLDLSNGKLSNMKPKMFSHLQNLQSLDLSNNSLLSIEPNTFQGLNYLKSLNLSRNLLEKIPLDVNQLKNLNYIDLSNNNFSCDCKNLKLRDKILKLGVNTLENNLCSSPNNLKGRPFIEPDAEAVCMLDMDEGMQMDQPNLDVDGSGESSGDEFDDIDTQDIPEDDDSTVAMNNHTTLPIEIPLAEVTTTSDELFFTEEVDRNSSTVTSDKPVRITPDILSSSSIEPKKETEMWPTEGSGDDDGEDPWLEGSAEGSGTSAILPRIKWDFDDDFGKKADEDDKIPSNTSPSSVESTTEAEGFIDMFYDFFWGQSDPVTETSSSTTDLGLEEEQFIDVSSTPEVAVKEEKKPVTEETIVPSKFKPVDKDTETFKPKTPIETKVEKVAVEADDTTETPDASAAKQSKKGMGSYVVLTILLGVLATLIGLAAYKSDFCKGGRKRRNNPGISDVENGTEMKDMRKSLLDDPNSVQPKISSNGNAESDPLMNSDKRNDDEPTKKFTGNLNDSTVDPIKPPRKSYSPNEVYEDEKKNGTNGKAMNVPESTHKPKDSVYNGRNDRDSLSSNGSHLSNSRLSQRLSSGSPNAQRVLITLQDNPDSIPKTPLLITRTKAGENLVKTP